MQRKSFFSSIVLSQILICCVICSAAAFQINNNEAGVLFQIPGEPRFQKIDGPASTKLWLFDGGDRAWQAEVHESTNSEFKFDTVFPIWLDDNWRKVAQKYVVLNGEPAIELVTTDVKAGTLTQRRLIFLPDPHHLYVMSYSGPTGSEMGQDVTEFLHSLRWTKAHSDQRTIQVGRNTFVTFPVKSISKRLAQKTPSNGVKIEETVWTSDNDSDWTWIPESWLVAKLVRSDGKAYVPDQVDYSKRSTKRGEVTIDRAAALGPFKGAERVVLQKENGYTIAVRSFLLRGDSEAYVITYVGLLGTENTPRVEKFFQSLGEKKSTADLSTDVNGRTVKANIANTGIENVLGFKKLELDNLRQTVKSGLDKTSDTSDNYYVAFRGNNEGDLWLKLSIFNFPCEDEDLKAEFSFKKIRSGKIQCQKQSAAGKFSKNDTDTIEATYETNLTAPQDGTFVFELKLTGVKTSVSEEFQGVKGSLTTTTDYKANNRFVLRLSDDECRVISVSVLETEAQRSNKWRGVTVNETKATALPTSSCSLTK